ncbi:MAG: hypothetical protein IT384_29955 [Deltaproteobacteria bacterium]|nr:hypothetical protein [Deltaproteobacteria bacterium]
MGRKRAPARPVVPPVPVPVPVPVPLPLPIPIPIQSDPNIALLENSRLDESCRPAYSGPPRWSGPIAQRLELSAHNR